jgi:CheY-like chemotaxis protein/anti-sigma regulatory factor (Ser/Thr protein kinase)
MLRSAAQPQPRQLDEGLAAIESGAEAQKRLIDDLLDTSRIAAGKLRLQMKDVSLAEILGKVVDSVLPAAQAKHITLSAQLADDIGMVRADPDRLRQIVWNLLTNAVEFTSAGGRVSLQLSRHLSEVEIRVTDTGVGISAAFLPHVFERFRQADASLTRAAGGLGLGLAIVKQLVILHGGTVSAQSDGLGRGATFIIRLPLAQLGDSNRIDNIPGQQTGASLAGIHVLLVEDHAPTRYALDATLKHAGARVTPAAGAADAFAAYQADRPDLIVSDIAMAGGNGYDLIRQIRTFEASQKSPPVPAVALTAFAGDEDRRLALEAGFQHHVAKPTSPDDLVSALTTVLDSR